MVTLRFLDINKRVVPQIIMLFTCFSIQILSFTCVCALLSAASQPLRGDMIRCYNEGESVKVSLLSDDPCITCKCYNQEITCQREICQKQEDSQCKVDQNLTNYLTFDGKQYTFKGKCNYILARDCKTKAFSVHLVNKFHNDSVIYDPKNGTYYAGSSIMIKIGDIKVRLGVMGKVRVGRKIVRLPHVILGTLSIAQDGPKIFLRANIGLKVIWEKDSFVEVIISPDFKSKTCGLCGNYNNNPNDDFITKRGNIITEIDKFTNSWRVGKSVICPNAIEAKKTFNEQITKCTFKKWEQRYHAINICNILKSSLFRQCHASVSINPYFGKCLLDQCLCAKTQVCRCTAVQEYSKKCQQMGFFNPHWKKKTLCEAMNCPRGSTFSTCSSPCKRTCKNFRKRRVCRKSMCKPGCECPIGQVWHNAKCIYKQRCPLPTPPTTETPTNFLKEEIITWNIATNE